MATQQPGAQGRWRCRRSGAGPSSVSARRTVTPVRTGPPTATPVRTAARGQPWGRRWRWGRRAAARRSPWAPARRPAAPASAPVRRSPAWWARWSAPQSVPSSAARSGARWVQGPPGRRVGAPPTAQPDPAPSTAGEASPSTVTATRTRRSASGTAAASSTTTTSPSPVRRAPAVSLVVRGVLHRRDRPASPPGRVVRTTAVWGADAETRERHDDPAPVGRRGHLDRRRGRR